MTFAQPYDSVLEIKGRKMTKKQKQKYLKDYNHCPKCGSDNISSDRLEADSGCAWANVKCDSCGFTWQDIYKLVDIEEMA